jgi:hypothetical protein
MLRIFMWDQYIRYIHVNQSGFLMRSSLLLSCTFALTSIATLAHAEMAARASMTPIAPKPPEAEVKLTYGGTSGVQHRSNIYREGSNTTGDTLLTIAPGFAIRSKKDNHNFTVKGSVEGGHYISDDDNDYVDADIKATSDFTFSNASLVQVHGQWRRDHVEVGGFSTDIGDVNRRAKTPTLYSYGEVGADYKTPIGESLEAKVGAIANYYNYNNQDDIAGRRIIQDDRDRYELMGTTQLGYKLQPNLMPFIAADVNARTYRRQVDATARYERDSSGGGVFAGLQVNDPAVDVNYAIARIGWLHQNYDNNFLPDVDTVGFDGKAAYHFNDATRMEANAVRESVENTLFGASGAVKTGADATLYHMLAAAWNADATARYTQYDFSINPLSGRAERKDHLYEGVVGINYDIANPIYLRGEYEYANRTSNESRARYTDHGVMMQVGMTY